MVDTVRKICIKCGIEKDLSEFVKVKHNKDGHAGFCKECANLYKGMQEWHIDHIRPLVTFNLEDREEFLKAVHYTNLQPLWATENFKKHDKFNLKTGGVSSLM